MRSAKCVVSWSLMFILWLFEVWKLTKERKTLRGWGCGLRFCCRSHHPWSRAHHWPGRVRRERPEKSASTSHSAGLFNGFKTEKQIWIANVVRCCPVFGSWGLSVWVSGEIPPRTGPDEDCWIEKEKEMKAVKMFTEAAGTSPYRSVAASHWSTRAVTSAPSANEKPGNETSLLQSQWELGKIKTPL